MRQPLLHCYFLTVLMLGDVIGMHNSKIELRLTELGAGPQWLYVHSVYIVYIWRQQCSCSALENLSNVFERRQSLTAVLHCWTNQQANGLWSKSFWGVFQSAALEKTVRWGMNTGETDCGPDFLFVSFLSLSLLSLLESDTVFYFLID